MKKYEKIMKNNENNNEQTMKKWKLGTQAWNII
jgi:hypothetical protein